jgi:hypothetical protein
LLSEEEALGVASALVEAAAEAEGIDAEAVHWRRVPVQFLHFEAERSSEDELETANQFASVRCWISGQTQVNAVYVATGWIKELGWTILNQIAQYEVTRADYTNSEEERYYEQVLVDGEVFVFEVDSEDEEDGDVVEQ